MTELSRSYMEVWKFDAAKEMIDAAYKKSKGIRYLKGLGDACFQYGTLYFWRYNNPGHSEKYYREAIHWYEKIGRDDGLGNAYRGLGFSLRALDSIVQSREAYQYSHD